MTAVFDVLFDISINSLWVIGAVLLVRALLTKRAKSVRMLLWALVALRLLIPFTLESDLSLIPAETVIELTAEEEEGQAERLDAVVNTQTVPNIQNNAGDTAITDKPAVNEPISDNGGDVQQAPVADAGPDEQPDASQGGPVADAVPLDEGEGVKDAWSYKEIAVIVWLVGAVLLLCWHGGSHIALRLRLRDAYRSRDNIWRSDRIPGAFSYGIIKPKIYIPSFIKGEEEEYVIAHERAHISHGDHIYKLLAIVISCVYWFNPLVWLSYFLFNGDMELACDERVIRSMDRSEVKKYAKVLLQHGSGKNIPVGIPLSFNKNDLQNRIINILNYRKPEMWVVVTCILLSAVIVICFMTVPVDGDDNNSSDTKVSATEGTEETEPIAETTEPTDSTESTETAENTEPSTESTEPSTEVTEPEPSEPQPTEPIPTEPETAPVYNFISRDIPLEGEAFSYNMNTVSKVSTFLFNTPELRDIGSTRTDDFVTDRFGNVDGQRVSETILVISSYARLKESYELIKYYDISPGRQDKDFEGYIKLEECPEMMKYDEEYFKSNVLILLFRSDRVTSVNKLGTELCLCVEQDFQKSASTTDITSVSPAVYIPPCYTTMEVLEIEKHALIDVDTISVSFKANFLD